MANTVDHRGNLPKVAYCTLWTTGSYHMGYAHYQLQKVSVIRGKLETVYRV